MERSNEDQWIAVEFTRQRLPLLTSPTLSGGGFLRGRGLIPLGARGNARPRPRLCIAIRVLS